MRVRLVSVLVLTLPVPLLRPINVAVHPSASTGDGRALLRRAAAVMDAVKTVHGMGTVASRYYKQHTTFAVTGDCDASPAQSRSAMNFPIRARTWVHGRYMNNGKSAMLDAHYVLIGTSRATAPKVWERSTRTHNAWKAGTFTTAGIASYAGYLCSVLFMAPMLAPTNVKERYENLGSVRVAGTTARFVRVTATKPGESFEYDWYIDPVSNHVVRLRTVIADAAPAPPNTSQSVTFTYSSFDKKLVIRPPATS